MIHYVGAELGAQLKAKGCPIAVIDGPERRPTTTFARERIVIEHNPAGDSFTGNHIAGGEPSNARARTRLTRNTGVRVTIYAQEPSAGAIEWEHRQRAEHVLDLVLIGLSVVAVKRQNLVVFKSGKFIDPPDLKESETFGGAVYELLLTFDRGVADRNWNGTTAPTATAGSDFNFKNKTTAEDPAGDTETACGGT